MAAIEVRDLTKRYGDVVANDGLSFSVEAGEVFGFLGPNGAGKTTCIRTLLGFQSPTAGTATVLGADVRDAEALRQARADVGYLPARPSFDEDVTGEAFLDYQTALKGDQRRSELLELFDPPLERTIRGYSSGNAQMLAIVQAFMHDPDLVILDEPTSGLDPLKQERFHEFVRRERDDGVTVFFSSHVLGEVRRVCDRVGIIRGGSLAALEDVDSLLRRGGKRVRVRTADSLDAAALDLPGVVDLERVGQRAQFTFTGDYNDLLDHLAAFDVVDLDVEEPPLEDVFMHFYGERAADGATEDGAVGRERTEGRDGERSAGGPPAEGGDV
ncbi:ABC transporter ATP-binding protein [Halomicrobium urmianum]|uniref:ABC transporter ATP-binding protein n=1 Tax=Halomicrobium urmianum TaxID=1586233 RepID=UPI001CD99E5C|nr:ABC transporter ATP-binding protein [Halomicrobium urmianum]